MEVPPGALLSLLPADRHLRATHSARHLNALIPLLAALEAAVDLEHDAVVFDIDFGDLDQIAGARRRAALLRDRRPFLLVPRAIRRRTRAPYATAAGATSPWRTRTSARESARCGPLRSVFRPPAAMPGNSIKMATVAAFRIRHLSAGGSIIGENCRRTGIFQRYSEQQHQHREGQNAGLRAIFAAAPQLAGGPRHLVARHTYSKPAHVHPEKRQCKVPAEVQPDGQPKIAAAQVGVSEQNAETGGDGRAQRRRARDCRVQQRRTGRRRGRMVAQGPHGGDQHLQAVAAKQQLFADRLRRPASRSGR